MFYLTAAVASPWNLLEHMYNFIPEPLYFSKNNMALDDLKHTSQMPKIENAKRIENDSSKNYVILFLAQFAEHTSTGKSKKKTSHATCLQYTLQKQAQIAQQEFNKKHIKLKHKFPTSKISSMSHRNGLKHG